MRKSTLPADAPLWMRVSEATGWASADAGGDKVCAAVSTRVRHSARFSEYSSFDHPDRTVSFENAVRVDKHNLSNGKSAHHLELAASELNFLLVRVPQGAGPSEVMAASGRSAEKMGALMLELGQALADGKLCGPEKQAIRERIRRLQVGLATLDAAVEADDSAALADGGAA